MDYLVVKSIHVMAIVAWFSGLFYLPRLFVYHALSDDTISCDRFKVMERKLYYGITWPSAILTTGLGVWLLLKMPTLMQFKWMHYKFGLVLLLWVYHYLCGYYLRRFAQDENYRTHVFYRWFNEVPVLFLVGIVYLVVVKPIF